MGNAAQAQTIGHLLNAENGSQDHETALQILEQSQSHLLSPDRGFLPRSPLAKFRTGYSALGQWDELVHDMHGALLQSPSTFRERVRGMPVLRVSILRDQDELLRASCVLANVAQTYYYCGLEREAPPAELLSAWVDVREKLGFHVVLKKGDGRESWQEWDLCTTAPFVTYIDLVVYNWQWVEGVPEDQRTPGAMALDSVQLLIPSAPHLNRRYERTFNNAQTLMVARGAELPRLCAQAQLAAKEKDDDHLKRCLVGIRKCWEAIADAFAEISPLQDDGANFVDQVFFGQSFASTPVIPGFMRKVGEAEVGTPAPDVAASPLFQLMDYFFNRAPFSGKFGEYNDDHTMSYPAEWRRFLLAVRKPDLHGAQHVDTYLSERLTSEQSTGEEDSPAARLRGLYSQALSAYQGPEGFLGRHLLKLYGYLAVSFRTGGEETFGDSPAGMLDRVEDTLYRQLEAARQSRMSGRCPTLQRAWASIDDMDQLVQPCSPASGDVWSARLSLKGGGVQLSGGDHVHLYVQNAEEDVVEFEACVARLGVPLSEPLRPGIHESAHDVDTVAALWEECLSVHEQDSGTRASHPDQTVGDVCLLGELPDRAVCEAWTRESVMDELRKIQPLAALTCSASSVVSGSDGEEAESCDLILRERPGGAVARLLSRKGQRLPVRTSASPLWRGLRDAAGDGLRRPALMFAAGAGVSPLAWTGSEMCTPRWLLWTTRDAEAKMVVQLKGSCPAGDSLRVDVLVTGGRCDTAGGPGNFRLWDMSGTPREHRLSSLAPQIREWLTERREERPVVFVCGSAGWCQFVAAFLQHDLGDVFDLSGWSARGRFRCEVLSDAVQGPPSLPEYSVQQVVSSERFLIVIHGRVCDVEDFVLNTHPGGRAVLELYRGADATAAYELIGHSRNQSIEALVRACQVGWLRMPCQSDVFSLPFKCRELQNALRLDCQLQDSLCALGQADGSELHAIAAEKTSARFESRYKPFLLQHGLLDSMKAPAARHELTEAMHSILERAGRECGLLAEAYHNIHRLVVTSGATFALASLVTNGVDNGLRTAAAPGLLRALSRQVVEGGSDEAARAVAVVTLGGLAKSDADSSRRIGELPGFLEALGRQAAEGSTLEARSVAAFALGVLAMSSPDNSRRIGGSPGTPEALARLVAEGDADEAKSFGAFALGCLATSSAENSRQLGTLPGLLEALARLVAEGRTDKAKSDAAIALGRLAWSSADNCRRIGALPELPEALARLVAEGSTEEARPFSAFALGCLAMSSPDNSSRIGALPGLLEALARLVAGGSTVEEKSGAAFALGRLAESSADNSRRIGAMPGLLEALARLVGEGSADEARRWAAFALGGLADVGEGNSRRIVELPGLLDALGRLVAEGGSDEAKSFGAAFALGRLAESSADSSCQIGALPGLLEALARLVGEGHTAKAQSFAAAALGRLAKSSEVNGTRICATPGLLQALSRLELEGGTDDVRRQAAFARRSAGGPG